MSKLYTLVEDPESGISFAREGSESRATAIAAVRATYEKDLQRIQAFLALSDDQLKVRVVRGLYRQKIIKELEP